MTAPLLHGPFWNRLLGVADVIDDPGVSADDLRAHLLAVEEGHGQALDPADQFPEYTALMMCRALRRRLEREGRRPPGHRDGA